MTEQSPEESLIRSIFGSSFDLSPEQRAEMNRKIALRTLDLPSDATISDEELRSKLRQYYEDEYHKGGETLRDYAEEVFSVLEEVEREVLKMRFGLDDGREKTLKEVGEAIQKSARTAKRIEDRALAKLRQPENRQQLKSYLE